MKKFTSTALGGAPVFDDDLLDIFNSEIWSVIQGMLSPFDSDTEGLVISGCVTTNNAGNFDMTAGIVYLNGEFMRIAAVTNQSFTKYIAPSTAVNDDRTFEDGSVNTVAVTKGAGLVGSAPGSGQYITIASLTDLDNRRFKLTLNDNSNIRTKVIAIGDWDMDGTTLVNIAHGISGQILSVCPMIISDSGSPKTDLRSQSVGGSLGGGYNVDSTNVILFRTTGGIFDNTGYDATSFNRGYIYITYIS